MPVTQIKVRGYHEDRFGHVNHARYLELLEEARWADFEARGLDIRFFKEQGIFPVVFRLTISYRRPAGAGDVLNISTEVKRSGRRKIVLVQEARFDTSDEVCIEAEISVVFIGEATGRPISLGDPFYRAWPELCPEGSDTA